MVSKGQFLSRSTRRSTSRRFGAGSCVEPSKAQEAQARPTATGATQLSAPQIRRPTSSSAATSSSSSWCRRGSAGYRSGGSPGRAVEAQLVTRRPQTTIRAVSGRVTRLAVGGARRPCQVRSTGRRDALTIADAGVLDEVKVDETDVAHRGRRLGCRPDRRVRPTFSGASRRSRTARSRARRPPRVRRTSTWIADAIQLNNPPRTQPRLLGDSESGHRRQDPGPVDPIIALTVRENEKLESADTAAIALGRTTNTKRVGQEGRGRRLHRRNGQQSDLPAHASIAGEKYFEVVSGSGRRTNRRRHAGNPRAEGRHVGSRAQERRQEATGNQIVTPNTTGERVDEALATTGEHSLSTTAERKAVVDAPGEAPSKDWVIVTRGLKREYDMGGEIVRALRGVDVAIRRNEYVAIMGPSGSGKSTLMNLIGCLDTPNDGEYWLNGMLVSRIATMHSLACGTRRSGSSSRRSTCSPRDGAA